MRRIRFAPRPALRTVPVLRTAAVRTAPVLAAAALLTLAVAPVQAQPPGQSPATGTGQDQPSSTGVRAGHGGHGPKAPEEFVALRDVAPTIRQEIRYVTPHNFVGEPIDGYRKPLCLVTRDTAKALATAQRSLLRRGYTLKVYDCYRPQRAVEHFVRWAKDLDDQRMKAEFYPRVDKSRLFEDGYIAEKSGHSRGSTVDLTLVRLPAKPTRPYEPGEPLVDCAAPKGERFPDNSVDTGTGFDCFDTLSHTDDPRIQGKQRANRLLLKNTLEKAGFANLPEEWWHFTHKPETFPDTYFDFPVTRRSLSHPH
ncbi:M15 family metallopeptidase [Streptomyces iconiensis]|uniref:D-alanyl-D-alanine dipeptidase n=1 Tax=Streptomyces iconiensis TaxID=1384038 RepID=A0ABT7A788_9ACTN|nr:M15 family metallopeptidase [Streptomyces iconiensis]MDJ1137166.1 M15 family metallopeptidase [Streptomyces iconiensis]